MKYVIGNLLDSNADALVNTVNTVGVMGKGIALQFKERFPVNFKIYASECKAKRVEIGKMLIVKENSMYGEKTIINFPTKTEWFKKSQYNYIEEGLKDLKRVIEEYKIKSIAIPPLGSGNGGLKWDNVKILMEKYLGDLKGVDIEIYEPSDAVKKILQEQNQRDIELKPGRAMLLYALFKYERLGEVASVFVANKLAYFLQKSGENLKLQFVPYTYGPYAQAVDKVLYSLRNKYIHGMEQMSARAFEPLQLNYDRLEEVQEYMRKNLNPEQHARLKNVFEFIDGFESALSLEILSSIHYLLEENPQLNSDELLQKIKDWNKRKSELIDKEHVEIALKRIKEHGSKLNFA
ncbi:MAG: macro domain-containing protein [Chitinophagaceae bacterium]|nr:macro domain-containing protein [Chitinophagaceae bacterium]